jgi:hypothetical protein
MSRMIRMMRMTVPTPMYMTSPLVAVDVRSGDPPCERASALPTVGLSKPAEPPHRAEHGQGCRAAASRSRCTGQCYSLARVHGRLEPFRPGDRQP